MLTYQPCDPKHAVFLHGNLYESPKLFFSSTSSCWLGDGALNQISNFRKVENNEHKPNKHWYGLFTRKT